MLPPPIWQEAQLASKILAPLGVSAACAGGMNVNLDRAIADSRINKNILKKFSSQQASATENTFSSHYSMAARSLISSSYIYNCRSLCVLLPDNASAAVEYKCD